MFVTHVNHIYIIIQVETATENEQRRLEDEKNGKIESIQRKCDLEVEKVKDEMERKHRNKIEQIKTEMSDQHDEVQFLKEVYLVVCTQNDKAYMTCNQKIL